MGSLRYCSDNFLEGSSLSLWALQPEAGSFHKECETNQIEPVNSNVHTLESLLLDIHVWDYSIK